MTHVMTPSLENWSETHGAAPFVSVIDFITTSKKHTTGVKEHTGNNYSDYGLNYDLNYGLGYG